MQNESCLSSCHFVSLDICILFAVSVGILFGGVSSLLYGSFSSDNSIYTGIATAVLACYHDNSRLFENIGLLRINGHRRLG